MATEATETTDLLRMGELAEASGVPVRAEERSAAG